MTDIRIKRAYEEPGEDDGYRVLVDRLWPRGLRKESLRMDLWAKGLAPSSEVRKAFGHKPERWEAFQRDFRAELDASDEARELATQILSHPVVTLLFGAKDTQMNNAVVLADWLRERE